MAYFSLLKTSLAVSVFWLFFFLDRRGHFSILFYWKEKVLSR